EQKLQEWITPPILSKTGAEGVFMAAIPDRGVGMALKVSDGATRAAEVAISALFAAQGLLDPARARRQLRNKAGRPVGWLEAVFSGPHPPIRRTPEGVAVPSHDVRSET
ncbi:asparaginase, partial [Okeania sp. SIO2B9]|uniref:asparaginase n=1 Tax=Okeania sp. SIO2B9 TaxID=2607782 RepID=UPI0014293191